MACAVEATAGTGNEHQQEPIKRPAAVKAKKPSYRFSDRNTSTDGGRWVKINGREVYCIPFTVSSVIHTPATARPSLPQHQHDAEYFSRMVALKLSHLNRDGSPEEFPRADWYGTSEIRCWRGHTVREWYEWDAKEKKLHLMRETTWESPEIEHLAGVFEAERAAERLCAAMGLVWAEMPEEAAAAQPHPFTAVLAEAEAQGIGADAMPPRLTMEDRQMILDQLAYFGVDVDAATKLGDAALETLQDDTVTAAWERKTGHDCVNN